MPAGIVEEAARLAKEWGVSVHQFIDAKCYPTHQDAETEAASNTHHGGCLIFFPSTTLPPPPDMEEIVGFCCTHGQQLCDRAIPLLRHRLLRFVFENCWPSTAQGCAQTLAAANP